jgi:transcriptional regulator with XRE-family HTH domain
MPLNSIDKHVGGRVRMRRMMLGVTQTDLGDALGSRSSKCKNTNGSNRVSASRLQHISHILQVPISFFFGFQWSRQRQRRVAQHQST